MGPDAEHALRNLAPEERSCLRRYLAVLIDQLGDNLAEIRLFGSAARADMWSPRMPMHSDIDLLVLTHEPVPNAVQHDLSNETYPLFLECGRQIGPMFKTASWFAEPGDPQSRDVVARIEAEGSVLVRR